MTEGRTLAAVPMPADHVSRMVNAFPSALEGDIRAVCAIMPSSEYGPTDPVAIVHVDGETLSIPHRVYFDEPSEAATVLGVRGVILACVYSRHRDGFVRERYAKRLLSCDDAWVPPFVVQLAGEYVLEIIQLLASHLEQLRLESYRSFVAQNPAFMVLTRQRMVSYWDCYYRREYPRMVDYPGHHVLEALHPTA